MTDVRRQTTVKVRRWEDQKVICDQYPETSYLESSNQGTAEDRGQFSEDRRAELVKMRRFDGR